MKNEGVVTRITFEQGGDVKSESLVGQDQYRVHHPPGSDKVSQIVIYLLFGTGVNGEGGDSSFQPFVVLVIPIL